MGQTHEKKRHYKLYKAKKRWVSAAIITASGMVLFVSPVAVSADETAPTDTTMPSTQTQKLQEKTAVDTNTAQNEQVAAVNTPTENLPTKSQTPPPTTQADHDKGNVNEAWTKGYRGQGMVVSVIDSGTDTTHKDFQKAPTTPKLSKDEVSNKVAELGYGQYVSEKFPYAYNYASKSNDWIKEEGPNASQHGQHVAGIIGANGQPNGDEKYAVGVAPESQLLALRVFNSQFPDENTDDIAQAIYDAVRLKTDVIQMSLGQGVVASDLNNVEQKAVQYAIDHGVFVSISASNSGHAGSVATPKKNYSPGGDNGAFSPFSSSTIANPGVSRNALTVAAENSVRGDGSKMAAFSSWGPLQDLTLKPDLAAPGVNIVSTANDNYYKTKSGTSMAGPFAAGAAALVMQRLQQDTTLKNAKLVQAAKALLMNTAKPMLDPTTKTPLSPRQQGAGQIDVGAAVSSPVYITADDGTSSLSLRKIGSKTTFNLNFTNLSDTDQSYTFDDLGGALTEKRATDTGHYYEVPLTNANVTGTKQLVVKAQKTLTVPYTLNLDESAQNKLVEGWLRFSSTSSPSLVVPYLGYFGDMTSEDVFDKAANDKQNVYGGNYFVNEHDYPRGIADEQSLKKLVNLDGNYDWQQVAKLYQDGKVAFSPNNDKKSDLLKPVAFVKQNLQDLKVVVLDDTGKVVRVVADEKGLDKSFYQSGYNQDVSLSVSMRNDPTTFDWDGKLYDTKTGEFVVAPDGQYTYRFVATLYNDGQKKVQTADYPVVIDTTAPTITDLDLKVDTPNTGKLSFNYTDTGAGFTDYSYAVLKINDQVFGHKLNDGASTFTDKTKTAGSVKITLSPAELAALSAANNAVTVMVSDTADNMAAMTKMLPGLKTSSQQVSVWNATAGLGFDKNSPDYDVKAKTFTLRGGATRPFYYNKKVVPIKDHTYEIKVAPDTKQVVFSSDLAGKNVLFTLNTTTPKAAFAWQKAHTTKQSFGITLDTVTTNDPKKVLVYAAVTNGPNVKAFARDYFTGEVYEAAIKDGLATFDVTVKNASQRTVLVGWTEVFGPTFNAVQSTADTKAYLGVDVSDDNLPQNYVFSKVAELQTELVQEKADPTTLGAPTPLPGHALSDLTTRSDPNPEIKFDYLKDNDYNWLGAKTITDGVYDPKTQTFIVTGRVSPKVVNLAMLGDSPDEGALVDQVALNTDGTFTFNFKIEPTKQRPLAYIYTTQDGHKTHGTIQLILDTVLPTLELENVANYDFDGENYYVYTNEPTFVIKGQAHDNLDGYRFFFNGDNDFREFHHSGVNHGGDPYAPYSFAKSFTLNDATGATKHVYTLDVLDVTGNHTTRKFYVYYQPKTSVPQPVKVKQKQANAFVAQYPATTLLFFDKKLQSYKKLSKDETHPAGLYYLVNKYGNVVATMEVYTDNFENKFSKLLHEDKVNQTEQTTRTSSEENPPAEVLEQTAAKQVAKVDQMSKTKDTTLPQTGEVTSKASLLGILLGLASLLTLLGFKTNMEEK